MNPFEPRFLKEPAMDFGRPPEERRKEYMAYLHYQLQRGTCERDGSRFAAMNVLRVGKRLSLNRLLIMCSLYASEEPLATPDLRLALARVDQYPTDMQGDMGYLKLWDYIVPAGRGWGGRDTYILTEKGERVVEGLKRRVSADDRTDHG